MQLITPDSWTVVVPLKSSALGKSRIDVDPALRRALARAMAADTVAAAAAAPTVGRVLIVADDPEDARHLIRPGVTTTLTAAAGLNEAITDGLASLPRHQRVAVLPADLPSLTPDELQRALACAGTHDLAVVADRQGTGTTLLTASSPARLHPRYGDGSFARHVAAGAVPLEVPVDSGLRRDVDVASDLSSVLGVRTLAVLTESACPSGLCAARSTG